MASPGHSTGSVPTPTGPTTASAKPTPTAPTAAPTALGAVHASLQLAGIACIEAISAWQTAAANAAANSANAANAEAAAKAACRTATPKKKPAPGPTKPAFMHGVHENYVLKMMHDLDFLIQVSEGS